MEYSKVVIVSLDGTQDRGTELAEAVKASSMGDAPLSVRPGPGVTLHTTGSSYSPPEHNGRVVEARMPRTPVSPGKTRHYRKGHG